MTRSPMKGYDSSKLKKVRLRHECKTSWLTKVNKNLTDVQKSRIQATPFKWLMYLPEKLKISGTLLTELASRWDKKSGSFRIRSKIVSFSHVDVCFALGLRIVSENVHFEEDLECHTKRLFEGKEITVKKILTQLEELDNDNDVEDFCRLYILLSLVEFYFPNTTPSVHGGFFKLLDDLQSLGKYNWGVAVYDFLVNSITRAAISFREEKNYSQLHIIGCAVILQVRAFEHVLVCRRRTSNVQSTFPRFLKWHDISIGDKKILVAFNENLVIEEVSVTNEELAHDVVKEALDQAPSGFGHWKHSTFDKKNSISKNQMLLAKNNELEKKKSHLEQQVEAIKQVICQSGMSILVAPSTSKFECSIWSKNDTQIENVEVDKEKDEVIRASQHNDMPPFEDVLDHQASNIFT